MTRAYTCTIVPVKVLMERNQVAPVGIGLKLFRRTEYGPSLVTTAQEDSRKAFGDFAGNFPERHHLP